MVRMKSGTIIHQDRKVGDPSSWWGKVVHMTCTKPTYEIGYISFLVGLLRFFSAKLKKKVIL
jgi:hypothetical protein